MFTSFGQVQARRQKAGSLRRERHSPGELRRGSLRVTPRPASARVLIQVAVELLCVVAIPAIWYLTPSPSSLPRPDVTAAQTGSPIHAQEVQVTVQRGAPTAPLLGPESIASPGALAQSQARATAPGSTEMFADSDAASEPLSTGSISKLPERLQQ